MVKSELIVERKVFKDDKSKEEVEYISCTATFGGVVMNFEPKKTDKKLFKYLMDNLDVPVEEPAEPAEKDKKGVK